MKKKKNAKDIITFVLVAAAAVSIALAFIMKYELKKQLENPQPNETNKVVHNTVDDEKITELSLVNPLLKTDITGYFYTWTDDGKVTFYHYENFAFTAVENGVESLDVTVSMSDRNITAKVYYLSINGKYCGYGIFNSSLHPEITIYKNILFHLTNLPAAKSGKALILVNSDSSVVFDNTKEWDDAFIVTLKNGSTTRFYGEKNRGVDITGAKRRDFCVTTDESIAFSDYSLFFSSKDYQTDKNGKIKSDLYRRTSNAETLVAQDVLGHFAIAVDGGFVFIKRTEIGFDVIRHSDKIDVKDTIVFSLKGNYDEAYTRSGSYLLDKENGVVYNLIDGKSQTLTDYTISAMTFCVSPDGNAVLITGTVTNALEYGVYVCNLTTASATLYIDSVFSTLFNPVFLSDSEFAYTVMDGNMYKTVAVKI